MIVGGNDTYNITLEMAKDTDSPQKQGQFDTYFSFAISDRCAQEEPILSGLSAKKNISRRGRRPLTVASLGSRCTLPLK
jgi:hypothetical protein